MITLTRPSNPKIISMLRQVADVGFTYEDVGCTERDLAPPRFVKDISNFRLGFGQAVWLSAQQAIREWMPFPSAMVSMVRLSDRIECSALGMWTINPARILAVHESDVNGLCRFGFTYGTLPGHVESGEEQFCVQWNANTDEVTYTIVAVSRPNHILCWLGYPYTRMMQAKFRRLSGIAMQNFVATHACANRKTTHRQTQALVSPESFI